MLSGKPVLRKCLIGCNQFSERSEREEGVESFAWVEINGDNVVIDQSVCDPRSVTFAPETTTSPELG